MVEAIRSDHPTHRVRMRLDPHSIPRAAWAADEQLSRPVRVLASRRVGMVVLAGADVVCVAHVVGSGGRVIGQTRRPWSGYIGVLLQKYTHAPLPPDQ